MAAVAELQRVFHEEMLSDDPTGRPIYPVE